MRAKASARSSSAAKHASSAAEARKALQRQGAEMKARMTELFEIEQPIDPEH
jgi:hypothetical protein